MYIHEYAWEGRRHEGEDTLEQVCVRVYTHTHTHTHTHKHTDRHIYTYARAHTHVYTCVYLDGAHG